MRFCMITTFYPPYSFGGDGVFVQDLATALAARGHDVHVIHCRDAYDALADRPPTASYAAIPGVTVHGLASSFGALSPLATQQTGRAFFKRRAIAAVLATGFDVIHYHNVSLVGGPEVLAMGGDATKLYTVHEYWLVCPTHLLYRFGRAPCTARKHCEVCTLAHGRPPQAWRHSGLMEAAVRHVDAFLSPSCFGIATHRRFGFTAPMIHLPSFVPDAPAHDTVGASAAGGADPYFLYAGRLESAKGPATLVDHFRRRGRARLVVAGAGSQEAELRRLAADDPRIVLLGRVDRDRLAALQRDAVAVVVPSLAFEMLPLVVLEAFRAGTPVVVRDRGALPEMVADSGAGLVWDDDDGLDRALARLLAEPGLRTMLGARGRAAYERRWSRDVHLERYLALVDDLRAGRRPEGLQA
jgi:glycosyltransferase involved in cell wall biosynthesis